MKSYTNQLFLFESINLKISKIYVCNLIIIYEFSNPLKNGISKFFILFQFFLENRKKIWKPKIEKVMGQIRGENIWGGRNFFSKALLSPSKLWNGAPDTLPSSVEAEPHLNDQSAFLCFFLCSRALLLRSRDNKAQETPSTSESLVLCSKPMTRCEGK